MGSCCGKREAATLDGKNGSTHNLANPQTSDISVTIEQTTRFLTENPLNRVVILTLPKDQLKGFIAALPKLMTFIKNKTNKIFVPTAIVNSPSNPNSEMMLMMRPKELLDRYLIDIENMENEDAIAKRYTVRVFQFISNKPQMRIDQLKTDLINLYKNEGLVIVGGIQDRNKANNLQLLMYKPGDGRGQDTRSQNDYSIQIEAFDSQRGKDEYETELNQIQLQRNEAFRCILSFEETYRTQFLVFQAVPSDNLYCVYKFPTVVHELHQNFLTTWGTGITPKTNMYPTSTVEQDRENILRKIAFFMNNEENQMSNIGLSIVVNTNFDDSYLIFNTA